ncbi:MULTISPECIES: lipopolysaccharide assembly protein LapA domain-containing protein [Shewanella]|uniref:Probable lipopolysaccharide assembly protein A n=1 Tax=Shewanella psychromarinicola TaxID=2487742 RepID=A0A3N4E505_9GAMM|nr:LapA family protein [Shewanella psychromarinicola]AZG36121.1 LapA family protein [Shewanella psychromarinicola]MCL1080494.1 LapA family protein [Shewanella psychromarinicola]RPA31812.1 LapA family protein [Shewanella psychromarinicola]
MRSFIVVVLVGLLFVLALLFGAKNEQVVTLSYFIAEGQYRLPIVLAVVFFCGFILSWIFASYHIIKLKLALRKSNKALKKFTAVEATSVALTPKDQVV